MAARPSSYALLALGLFYAAVGTPAGEAQDSTTTATAADRPLGKQAAFETLESAGMVLVPAGTALRARADPESPRLATIAQDIDLQVLERRGDWVRTAYEDWTGWLAPGGEEASELPVRRELSVPFLTLDLTPVERAAKLASALEFLGTRNDSFTSVGRWEFYTDVDDAELLRLLDGVAQQVPALYASRFGLLPPEGMSPTPVFLFADEQQYRAFTADNTDISGLEGGGHADDTMAALYVDGNEGSIGVAGTLVHELTHLLNRELFVKTPATWLEEGLANDLGYAQIDSKGQLRGDRLGGTTSVFSQRTSGRTMVNAIQTGGQAMWTQLSRDWRTQRHRLPTIDQLLDLPWVLFVDNDHRATNYALSAFFIRYLLTEADGDTTEAFKSFLAAAARGEATGSAALAEALATTPEAIRRDFERWLTMKSLTGL